MKIIILIGILVISIIAGVIIRIVIKNKPGAELLFWAGLMTFWVLFLIYSIVLIIDQDTPLFTKGNLSNEFAVIASASFIVSGYLYFKRNRNHLLGK